MLTIERTCKADYRSTSGSATSAGHASVTQPLIITPRSLLRNRMLHRLKIRPAIYALLLGAYQQPRSGPSCPSCHPKGIQACYLLPGRDMALQRPDGWGATDSTCLICVTKTLNTAFQYTSGYQSMANCVCFSLVLLPVLTLCSVLSAAAACQQVLHGLVGAPAHGRRGYVEQHPRLQALPQRLHALLPYNLPQRGNL